MSTYPIQGYLNTGFKHLFDHLSNLELNPNHDFVPSGCARIAETAINPLVDALSPQILEENPLAKCGVKILLGAGVAYGLNAYFGRPKMAWASQYTQLATNDASWTILSLIYSNSISDFVNSNKKRNLDTIVTLTQKPFVEVDINNKTQVRWKNVALLTSVIVAFLIIEKISYSRCRKSFPQLTLKIYCSDFVIFGFFRNIFSKLASIFTPQAEGKKKSISHRTSDCVCSCLATYVTIKLSQKYFNAAIFTKWTYPRIIAQHVLLLIKY